MRYHAASGNSEKALNTLKSIAAANGHPMLLGRLTVDDVSCWQRGRIWDLFKRDMKW